MTHPTVSTPPTASPMRVAPDLTDEKGLERMVFFSDAVFAIAITLLALEIRLPIEATNLSNAQLLDSLLAIWPKYLSFLISFMVIGSFWITHHRHFRYVTHYDKRILFLNLLLLMSIAFIPFPTSIISENGNRTATIFYALTIVVCGSLSAILWQYVARKNPPVAPNWDHPSSLATLITPAIFALSTALSFIDPDLAKFSWILIAPAAIFLR